jgi:DNA replication initiation complex subunit (GINS family)
MEELSYEEIRKIQARERASPVLQTLPDGFYKAARKLIEKKDEELKKNFSLTEAKEYESIVKVVEDIHERRKQKIILRAMKAGAAEEATLAVEEKELFSKIHKIVEEEAGDFVKMIEGKEGKVDEESIKRIKILKNLPKFVGVDLKAYGPFKEGDSTELPDKEAQLLVRRGIAEYIGGVPNEISK